MLGLAGAQNRCSNSLLEAKSIHYSFQVSGRFQALRLAVLESSGPAYSDRTIREESFQSRGSELRLLFLVPDVPESGA